MPHFRQHVPVKTTPSGQLQLHVRSMENPAGIIVPNVKIKMGQFLDRVVKRYKYAEKEGRKTRNNFLPRKNYLVIFMRIKLF